MGRKSKRKGYSGEHEVVLLCEKNNVAAKRTFMSGMFDPMGTDVYVDGKLVSVKRRANGMGMFYKELERADYCLFRADRKRWLKIEFWGLGKDKSFSSECDVEED